MCVYTRKPHGIGAAGGGLRASGRAKDEGPEQSRLRKLRPHDIEAGAPSMGCCRYRLAWCARPTGGSYDRITGDLTQRRGAQSEGRVA